MLLDPPCSALGLRPRLAHERGAAKSLAQYPKMQRNLFWSAVMLLEVGGVLVYSTCTVLPDENERLVRWALDAFPCLRLRPAACSPGAIRTCRTVPHTPCPPH